MVTRTAKHAKAIPLSPEQYLRDQIHTDDLYRDYKQRSSPSKAYILQNEHTNNGKEQEFENNDKVSHVAPDKWAPECHITAVKKLNTLKKE